MKVRVSPRARRLMRDPEARKLILRLLLTDQYDETITLGTKKYRMTSPEELVRLVESLMRRRKVHSSS